MEQTSTSGSEASRPARRRVLTGLGALPAGAVLAGAASAQAAPAVSPARGHGQGKGHGGNHGRFRLGLENLLQRKLSTLRGAKVGLITNPTGADRELTTSVDLLNAAQKKGSFELVALFGPEHGVRGAEPAGGSVGDYTDTLTGLPVRSLYGETQKPTPEMLEDVDTLVFDIQDCGVRYYTYIWTLYYAMEAAAEQGKRFVVLDRPNPLGRGVEGFLLDEAFSSFVGLKRIPQRHGLTVGELARYYRAEFLDGKGELEVIEMTGYDPKDAWPEELPWVLPSPNIPTRDTAIAYAGTGLVEAINCSEGRGTTTPFLWVGAPFITEQQVVDMIADLEDAHLPGVGFRSMFATPTTSKHEGEFCGGFQIHVLDQDSYEPVRTAVHVLSALFRHVPEVDWREGEDCRTEDDVCWIDKLSGTLDMRRAFDAGEDPERIVRAWRRDIRRFELDTRRHRLY